MNIYDLKWDELLVWIRQVVPTVERYNQLVTDGEKDSDEVQLGANALCFTVNAVKRVLNPPPSQSENLPPSYDLRHHSDFFGPTGLVSRFKMFRDLVDEVLKASAVDALAHSKQGGCLPEQRSKLRVVPASAVDVLEACMCRLAVEVSAHGPASFPPGETEEAKKEKEKAERINRDWASFAASLNKLTPVETPDFSENPAKRKRIFPNEIPKNRSLVFLAIKLNSELGPKKSMNEIAREFTGESKGRGNFPKADNLLAQLRALRKSGDFNLKG